MGPLRYRDFRLLWIGLVMQGIASWIHQVASGWQVLELTDSPIMLGLNGLFMSVPFFVASFYGGALADRMDRRRLLLVSQTIATLLAVAQGLLTALEVIQVWHIYALTLLSSTVSAFDAPARQALIPSLVPRHELMRAIALTAVIRRGTALVGPVIGGAAIALASLSGAYLLQAIFLAAMLVATVWLRSPPSELELGGTSLAGAILDGMKYVRSSPFILGVLSIEGMSQFFVAYVPILPVFARDVLHQGPTGLGLLYAAPGVGALIASAAMVAAGDVSQKGRLYVITALAKAAAAGLFALSPWMPTSMLLLAIVGLLDVAGGTVRTTMLQMVALENMRGRVMSMDVLVHRGLTPLSGLQLGALATVVGAPVAMSAGAVVVLAYATALFLRVPAVRQYHEDWPG